MWFIGVEVAQETSAPPPKKNPGSAPDSDHLITRSRVCAGELYSRCACLDERRHVVAK